ncbi:hypothetical protein XA68_14703 [Ophiocordyceps unilateralis]|uniref:Cytochrome P450 n=1 Tax=Ophiocordyceps unilateralis TaxID=268505 RepID=A0A2A9P839_OPHUN|nr:hypothetical protein XA68_14703 [Ophiocordyceps unilateralis]
MTTTRATGFPQGSLVYDNAWAMTHDESVYTRPDDFNPDRYAPTDEGGLGEPYPKGQFGFGLRLCIGKHLAEASLWIAAASLLSNVRKAVDDDGNEIEPTVKLTSGLTSHPQRFGCRICRGTNSLSRCCARRKPVGGECRNQKL